MKQKFKVGDKVYFPFVDEQIYTLEACDCATYPLAIKDGGHERPFTLNGCRYNDDPLPSIFHATPENHELLTKLYGVEFEAPPKTPKEVIQAMLDYGWECVPCFVADSTVSSRDFIIEIDSESDFVGRSVWSKAIPFDPKTEKIIIDFVDGKEITE